MKRTLLLIVALLVLVPASAIADETVFRDGDEEPFCEGGPCPDRDALDFRRVKQGHGTRPEMVTHHFRMKRRWQTSDMAGAYGISFVWYFDSHSGRGADRRVRVRVKDGEIVAIMTKGRYFDRIVPGRVWAWRPGRRGLKIAFDVDMLRMDSRSYRWYVTYYARRLACPGSCNDDEAPDRGWYTHRL